jgi:hypothetical protein
MLDPFGRINGTIARTLSREGRVQLLGELSRDLIAGRRPDPAAARWLGLQLAAWLDAEAPSKSADLARDFLEVSAPPRSKSTPQRLWATICRQKAEAQPLPEDHLIETERGEAA